MSSLPDSIETLARSPPTSCQHTVRFLTHLLRMQSNLNGELFDLHKAFGFRVEHCKYGGGMQDIGEQQKQHREDLLKLHTILGLYPDRLVRAVDGQYPMEIEDFCAGPDYKKFRRERRRASKQRHLIDSINPDPDLRTKPPVQKKTGSWF